MVCLIIGTYSYAERLRVIAEAARLRALREPVESRVQPSAKSRTIGRSKPQFQATTGAVWGQRAVFSPYNCGRVDGFLEACLVAIGLAYVSP